MDVEAIRRGAETPVEAGVRDLGAVATDLAAAFAHDPMFGWFMRTDARRDEARLAFFGKLLKLLAMPRGVIERPAAGGAAAIWTASEELGPSSLRTELATLPAMLSATGAKRFPRLLALKKAMDAHHPTAAHDYLSFVGVHPDAQGAGVGSRLLASHLVRLDAQGRAAFLETATPRNVALYNRHGFEIVEEYRPAPDAP